MNAVYSVSVLMMAMIGSVMSTCSDPKVTASSYTPADSQVLTAIPFIAEFSLACSNGEKPSLYADIDGALVPVTQSIDGEKYQVWKFICTHIFRNILNTLLLQVSWTKDTKVAKTGDHSVNLYDSEGYTAVKRSRERGEPVTTSPLVTIVVSYPGSYTGPILNSEHIAACLAAAVFYLAFSSKSKLLA